MVAADSNLPNAQTTNQQILDDIQQLQNMEESYLNTLETDTSLTAQEQQAIVEKMNQLSDMRINLYETLSGVNSFFQSALNSSVGTLQEQTDAVKVIEQQLNVSKSYVADLAQEQNNKIRLVQINDYFGEKYADHSSLMKIIIFTLIPIIILIFLKNRGILPNSIYTGLVVVISLIGIVFFGINWLSTISRSSMNYQEFDWFFDPSRAPSATGNTDNPWATTSLNVGTCVGEECCSTGQTYDTTLNQCIGDSTTTSGFSTMTETMINNVFIKNSGKLKPDYTIDGDNLIKPKQSDSFINYKYK
jgi:hypothetical protein